MKRGFFFAGILNRRAAFCVLGCLLSAGAAIAADFDGDGVADEFTVTHEAEKVAKEAGIHIANPWPERHQTKQSPKGLGIVVRLSRAPQKFLVWDSDFFNTPIWKEPKPPVRVLTKKDKDYAAWKKQVPALRGDAIQLGTEAGIDILLYWDGKWRLFWPDEEP